jgi:hypothetical protein
MARCTAITAAGKQSLLVAFQSDGQHQRATLTDTQGGLPQAVRFDVAQTAELRAFMKLLIALAPHAIEIVGAEAIPAQVLAEMQSRKVRYDVVLASTELAAGPSRNAGVHPKWRGLVAGAGRLIAPDRDAADFAKGVLDLSADIDARQPNVASPQHERKHSAPCLGIIALRADAAEFLFIQQLADRVTSVLPKSRVVVFGITLDDFALMQHPNVLVTGKIVDKQVADLVEAYAIDKVALDPQHSLFGHPLVAAFAATGRPMAAVAWSSARKKTADHLPLAPDGSRDEAVAAIANWFGRTTVKKPARRTPKDSKPVRKKQRPR